MLTIFFLFFKEKGRKGKTGLLPSNHPVNAYLEIDFSLVFFFYLLRTFVSCDKNRGCNLV